ncbi:MAG: electron transfer flavoprotein subunit alpha/FixB family protein [Coriobacteriales bacterium]|jgi:electron transfer flavoprotein alpha subunit|nr:electron transfer flavoprotein subunit alpha/FixB family protein [Coriobacteriales bacterium]
MRSLIFARQADTAAELLAGARLLGASSATLVVIDQNPSAPDWAASLAAERLAHLALPEGAPLETALESILAFAEGEEAGLVLVEPSRSLKVLVGGLAARQASSLFCNVTHLRATGAGSYEAGVLYFGGLAEQRLALSGPVAFFCVGAGVFASETQEPVVLDAEVRAAECLELRWVEPRAERRGTARVVEERAIESSGTDLAQSEIVVGCGRGFRAREDLALATALADELGAGLACTRPLAETEGWFTHEQYLGVSGKTLRPRVYIGAGISGQMQHLIGINRAGAIIAVNRDRDAPIFAQCDLGIVGDLREVLPALSEALASGATDRG